MDSMNEEKLCFDYLKDLVNSATQGDTERYNRTTKRIEALMKESATARHFFQTLMKVVAAETKLAKDVGHTKDKIPVYGKPVYSGCRAKFRVEYQQEYVDNREERICGRCHQIFKGIGKDRCPNCGRR